MQKSKFLVNSFKFIVLSFFIFALGFMSSAFAVTFNSTGNPTDTASGTLVTALATLETASYKDANSSLMPTADASSSGNDQKTTLGEYGFSESGAISLSVMPGDTVSQYYGITNEGNNFDSYTFSHRFDQFNGASGWVVQVWDGVTFVTTLTAGTAFPRVKTVSNDADAFYNYKVIVPTGAGAPNASYITIVSTFDTTAAPWGKYTGGNAFTYGGKNHTLEAVQDTVASPSIAITRTSTVDAPKAGVGYGGGVYDKVPGAIITYRINYNNTGSASAENVILTDKVPSSTNLAHFNTTGNTNFVNITMGQGNASGWTLSYSVLDNPSKAYGNSSDWSGANGGSIGTLTVGNEQFPGGSATYANGSGNIPYNAKWVKWEKLYVSAAENNNLTWGVSIR